MYFGVVVCKDIHELEEFKPRVHITTAVMIEGKSRDAGLTLMPVYHCHNPVFRPKMAIFRRAGMKEGGLPLPLAFQYLIFMI